MTDLSDPQMGELPHPRRQGMSPDEIAELVFYQWKARGSDVDPWGDLQKRIAAAITIEREKWRAETDRLATELRGMDALFAAERTAREKAEEEAKWAKLSNEALRERIEKAEDERDEREAARLAQAECARSLIAAAERTAREKAEADLEQALEDGRDILARWKKQIHEIGPALIARAEKAEAERDAARAALAAADAQGKGIEIRRDADGVLDEICATNCSFHFERMDMHSWWFAVEKDGKRVAVWLNGAPRSRIRVALENDSALTEEVP